MTGELFSYLRVQALISAVLNLFIGGVLDAKTRATRLLSRLFARPVAMCILPGLGTALILSAGVIPVFAVLRISAVPFYLYIALKCLFCAAMGAYVTVLVLFAGMLKPE